MSLHCPLLPSTYHLIDAPRVASLKHGAMLINVSRGGLIDSDAVLEGLERGDIGALVRAAAPPTLFPAGSTAAAAAWGALCWATG